MVKQSTRARLSKWDEEFFPLNAEPAVRFHPNEPWKTSADS